MKCPLAVLLFLFVQTTCFLIPNSFQTQYTYCAQLKGKSDSKTLLQGCSKEGDFLLAKTTESFKLSDLYFIAAKLEFRARNWSLPELLCVDPNTGSYLLQVDSRASRGQNTLPCLERIDWVAEKLAFGSTGKELIEDIQRKCSSYENHEDFILDYTFMGFLKGKDYTSKSLICRVAQCIPSAAALDPKLAKTRMMLIETPTGIHLANRVDVNVDSPDKDPVKRWSGRPFQYSSAINPTIASIVVDLIYGLALQNKYHTHGVKDQPIKMLDPTCGSGTFLAFALEKSGMDVVGYDINEACVKGTRENLEFLYGSELVALRSEVIIGDSASIQDVKGDGFDCAVANLPWGLNTKIQKEHDNKVSDIFPGNRTRSSFHSYLNF